MILRGLVITGLYMRIQPDEENVVAELSTLLSSVFMIKISQIDVFNPWIQQFR